MSCALHILAVNKAGTRKLEKQVLDLRWKVLGKEYPATSMSVCNLFTLSNGGDLDAAKDIMEKYILWLIDRGPTIPAVEQQKIREIIIEIIKRENQPVKLN